MQRLKHLIFDNFVIKMFSLVFAVILWMHVATSGTSEVNFMVPLELRDIPDEMAVVGNVPGLVDVRVQARESLMKRLTAKDISVSISLTGAKPGEALFTLTPSNVRAPGSVTVQSVSPAEIKLRLERLTRKTVPVKLELYGRPSKGYRVLKAEVSPPSVTVEGPENAVRKLEYVRTEKVDVNGVSGSIEKMAGLMAPREGGVKLLDENVQVTITVSRNRQSREGTAP